MSWKQRNYFAGQRGGGGHHLPRMDELSPRRRAQFKWVGAFLGVFLVGVILGGYFAPEGPRELKEALAQAQETIARQAKALEDARALGQGETSGTGRLSSKDRARQEREGRRYANVLRQAQAQAAADLMEWFTKRWNQMLDYPQPDDRTGRRAATLALLVGGMAANVNPGDYVPWQAEFFNADWLGDLHFDLDGDGFPGPRSGPNPHDGFANVSICQIAMALNQSVTDARVLIMPQLRCDRVDARMSVFLQGKTLDDALNEFVRAVRDQGFVVVEKLEKKHRLLLVGARPARRSDE